MLRELKCWYVRPALFLGRDALKNRERRSRGVNRVYLHSLPVEFLHSFKSGRLELGQLLPSLGVGRLSRSVNIFPVVQET
jgi:hypothetical protein